jgi:hypothetical protein
MVSLFLFGCGGDDDGGTNTLSTPSSEVNTVNPNGPVPLYGNGFEEVRTSDLVAQKDFYFSTDYQVAVRLQVEEPAGAEGYISLYSEFDEGLGKPNYSSRIVLSALDNQGQYEHTLRLPNHVSQVWAEVWYRDEPNAQVKQMLTVQDGVIDATLE